jgi:hypothetical protein
MWLVALCLLLCASASALIVTTTVDSGGLAKAIQVVGDLAYVADDSSGLLIFDVSIPDRPEELGRVAISGGALALDVDGDFAIVINGLSSVGIVDVSNPELPKAAGSFDSPGIAVNVDLADGVAYVVDLTAGLGGDAYRLAAAGHSVRGYERNAAVYAVLASGWDRARESAAVPSAVAERLSFAYGDGADQIAPLAGPNVGIYIDPMYPPPRRRSAKPRRELQVLRALLGAQGDAADLVERARQKAARVVVKRPNHADPLVAGASFEIETKLVRFDVYVNPERMEGTSSE